MSRRRRWTWLQGPRPKDPPATHYSQTKLKYQQQQMQRYVVSVNFPTQILTLCFVLITVHLHTTKTIQWWLDLNLQGIRWMEHKCLPLVPYSRITTHPVFSEKGDTEYVICYIKTRTHHKSWNGKHLLCIVPTRNFLVVSITLLDSKSLRSTSLTKSNRLNFSWCGVFLGKVSLCLLLQEKIGGCKHRF